MVSWGESTFIQNGINVINPIDVSKLRVAGAELKEAFLPIDMLWASFSFTDNLSMEALYLFEFEETEVDPVRHLLQHQRLRHAGRHLRDARLRHRAAAGHEPGDCSTHVCQLPLGSGFASADTGLPAVAAGLRLRATRCRACPTATPATTASTASPCATSPTGLNDTDFGFYFLNYHSRLPLLSGRTVSTAALTGVPTGLTAGFYVEYPEDIQMYGMSWNTTLPGGVAWQGEISYRPNMPLQVDDVELLFAALSPLNSWCRP